jgi:hypothetical protein
MLARRFSIVCAVAVIFGAATAMIVQDGNRPAYSWKAETSSSIYQR